MYRKLISLLFLASIMQTSLGANWTESLGELQKSDSFNKSYLLGMLTDQSYGIYKVENLKSRDLVLKLYENNENKLYWFDESGIISSEISELIESIKNSSNEGLNPNRYHLSEINFINKKITNSLLFDDRDLKLASTKMDILLSDAFLTLAKDLHQGQIDYQGFQDILTVKSEEEDVNYVWSQKLEKFNYLDILKQSRESGEIKTSLFALTPTTDIYNRFKDAYIRYRDVKNQGGFKKIPKSGTLKVGAKSNVVKALRVRLAQSGDLDYSDEENKRFDDSVKNALKRFQKRVGIWPAGVLNASTRRALNVPISKRLKKLKLNLERSRWERDSFDNRYVIVNIPEFYMRFMDSNEELISSRVIVGKPSKPTPIFQSKMSYVVLNPTWSVPNSIIAKEMLEHLQEDPYYLEDRNYKVYDGWNKKKRKEIDSFDVDWLQYDDASKIPYNIVQNPGKRNPLGRMKFMFPNKYAVYLHDTDTKKLFKKPVRAFSHGCIRLYQPQKFLKFVSNNYMDSSYADVKEKLDSKENESLNLNDKIPVYIRYYTAFVDGDGGVHFGKDIYGYDKIQQKLLN